MPDELSQLASQTGHPRRAQALEMPRELDVNPPPPTSSPLNDSKASALLPEARPPSVGLHETPSHCAIAVLPGKTAWENEPAA